jgi:hypothetical protein
MHIDIVQSTLLFNPWTVAEFGTIDAVTSPGLHRSTNKRTVDDADISQKESRRRMELQKEKSYPLLVKWQGNQRRLGDKRKLRHKVSGSATGVAMANHAASDERVVFSSPFSLYR